MRALMRHFPTQLDGRFLNASLDALPSSTGDFIFIWVYRSLNMGTHMKTTIEISDALLEAAKRYAGGRGTTLRALVEEGLRNVLDDSGATGGFTLRDASVGGKGLRPDVREGGWERIAELTYEEHGG